MQTVPPLRCGLYTGTTTLTTWARSSSPGTHSNLIRAHASSRPVLLSWQGLHVNLLITSASRANHQTTQSWNCELWSEDGWWQGAGSGWLAVVEVSSQPSPHLRLTGEGNTAGAPPVSGCGGQVDTLALAHWHTGTLSTVVKYSQRLGNIFYINKPDTSQMTAQ